MAKIKKRAYYLPEHLLDAWQEFHAPSKDYSPHVATAMFLYFSVSPGLREKAKRALYESEDIPTAQVKFVSSLLDEKLDQSEVVLRADLIRSIRGSKRTRKASKKAT
jgi:hypothetical protein